MIGRVLRMVTGHAQGGDDRPPRGVERTLEVRLLPARPDEPITLGQRLIVRVLERHGWVPCDALVREVSAELYREALGRGGWTVDIGLFSPRLWARDVEDELYTGNGRLWEISELGMIP